MEIHENTQQFVASNIPGEQRMLEVLRQGIRTSNQFEISVSFLRFSGLALIIDDLKAFAERGGKARILTSTYLGITQPEALESIQNIIGVDCRLHIAGYVKLSTPTVFKGFHTKLYIFNNGQKECWVGSSNLTKGGLSTNIEANLYHDNVIAVAAVEDVFNTLWNRPDVLPVSEEVVSAYTQALLDSPRLAVDSFTPKIALDITEKIYSSNKPEQLKQSEILASTELAKYRTSCTFSTSMICDQASQIEISSINRPMPNELQIEALERLRELRLSGESRAAIVAAPGVGKTFLAAFDAQQSGAKSLLFLSHRLEHISQAHRTFKEVFGHRTSFGRVYGGLDQSHADFVFSTVQSAALNRTLMNRKFDYVIIDEFHHADAPSYQRLLNAISARFLLGLTATPERQDGHDVLKLCDYNVAYEVRLVEAVNREWLIPFHYFGVSDTTVDYSSIPWRSGGFDLCALENALMLEKRVDEILKHAKEKGYDGVRRTTVGFCAGVRHANFMADSFNRRGQVAIAITGENELEYREAIYKRFEDPSDPLEWLFVADVLNEGVDIPGINSILFLRPTESATVFIQQLGRGLRLSKNCEVLTVLDFVGHHRTAWLAIDTLHDRDADTSASSIKELDFTPPKNCEVILDQKTLEIIQKVRRVSQSARNQCLEAYRKLRTETDRPYPLDLFGRDDCPDIGTFRTALGSWIELRRAVNDAEIWENELDESDVAFQFLSALERDWQQPRVYSYALVWALSVHPEMSTLNAYNLFFDRFPRWKVEYKPLNDTKVWQTLEKKLGGLLQNEKLDPELWKQIPKNRIEDEVEGRIRLTLEKDYRRRHGGSLRRPSDLVLHRRYDRPEIINFFGEQYDPARHNFGVVPFKQDVVIITKLDTSSAMQAHQYVNNFVDEQTFAWQSQNQQQQNNPAGRLILDHNTNGRVLHLFVQSRSHEKAYYCGSVSVVSVKGNAPMNVIFKLQNPLSKSVCDDLLVT